MAVSREAHDVHTGIRHARGRRAHRPALRRLRLSKPAEEQRLTGHTVSAVICVILAALLTTPAAVAFWGQRTLNDTQRYVDTVEPLVDSPEVQDAIATRVTDAIEKQVDIEAILNDVFAGVITDRPRLEQLVGPLSAAINGLIDREVRVFLASDEFADLWVRVNTRAQQALQRVLKGDKSGAVSVQGDELVLDVDEVIDQVKQRLVARGLTLRRERAHSRVRSADRADGGAPAGAGYARSTPSATRWRSGSSRSWRCCTWPPSCSPAVAPGWR